MTNIVSGKIRRGEVYYIRYDQSFGSEEAVGRPCVVVSNDNINETSSVVNAIYMTTAVKYGELAVSLTSTSRKSWALCNQIFTFDKRRFGDRMCMLTEKEMNAIDAALATVMGLKLEDPEALKNQKARHEAELATVIEDHKKELAAVREEVTGKMVDFELHKRLYDRALTELAELKFSRDLAAKEPVEAKEEPVVVEEPAEELIDINRCSLSALKNIGFSIATANMIIAARPYLKIEDLKIVPGVTKIAYRIVEKKITVGDVSEFVKKPKRSVKSEEPVKVEPVEVKAEEPVKVEEETPKPTEKVNVNTANGKEIAEALGYSPFTGYIITGYRGKNGPYKSLEELQNVPRLSKNQYQRCLEVLTV